MKCLNDTPEDIARRMRDLAHGVNNQTDAQAIRSYANWVERTGAAELVDAGGSPDAEGQDNSKGRNEDRGGQHG